jgi:LAO/AO transport system kinase
MLDELLQRFRNGDRLAMARLLTLAARGESVDEIRAALGPPAKPARVLVVTGNAGVGKSTLVGKLIEQIRASGQRVAVLACDPQSPLSGGALLGDRFRMPARSDDDGVFIRSLATASGQGTVARDLDVLVRLVEAFGFDVVLIETVGAGQGDTAVRHLADAVVVLLQPETGDDLQWEKAGLLEVADVVVVQKADLPGADRVEGQVKAMLGLSGAHGVPVLRVSAKTGEGVAELWRTLMALPLRLRPTPDGGRELLKLLQRTLSERYAGATSMGDPALAKLVTQYARGALTPDEAAESLADLLLNLRRSAVVATQAGGTFPPRVEPDTP